MKYLAWILGLFAAAVALAIVAHNPGYVQLVYPPYRIELSLTLFVFLLLLTFVSGYGLVRLITGVLQLPAYVARPVTGSSPAIRLRSCPPIRLNTPEA